MSLRDDFKEGDIVWAEWDDVKLRTSIGVVEYIHPKEFVQKMHERNGRERMDEMVMVKHPGYIAPRGFNPPTQCRHATEAEKRQYFRDVLKYGC